MASSQKYRRKQNSKRAEHIPTQHLRFLQGPDFRFQISECGPCPGDFWYRFQKQKTENKRAGLDFKGVKISDSRFRSGAGRCGMFNAEFRIQKSRLSGAQ
eukprot:scaffold66701_cov86-Phaeocystis_antarctica.AAC.1